MAAAPLSRRLLRWQLAVTALLGCAAIALVVQLRQLAALPPRILADNFRSVQATEEMDRALSLALIDPSDGAARDRFQRALADEQANITEPGEREEAEAIAADWRAFVAAPSPER